MNGKRRFFGLGLRRSDARGVLKTAFAVLLIAALTVSSAWAGKKVKNVIVMVPDGCSQSIQTLARWYKGAPLTLDEMVSGTVATYMSNSIITDSAPAATAFATGYKSTDKFLSVGPRPEDILSTLDAPAEDMPYKPLATVLEGARLMGKATGLVATSSITHATPAAFASHVHARSLDSIIMEHMVYQNIDVVFGGGKRFLIPEADGGRRDDGENLLEVLLSRGYEFVETRDAMMAATSGKVWGLFNASHMKPDIDRAELAPTEPSIAEMTRKAIDLLKKDEDGFFLMVEGSQVDWAGHANDPIYMLGDFIAFDDAVKVAVDFAKTNGETLVLAFPDHNTGGMTIGSYTASVGYTATTVEDLLDPLKGMKLSAGGVAAKIGDDKSAENIKAQLAQWWGIDATDGDIDEIMALTDGGTSLDYAIGKTVCKNHTIIGWTTHGHTGDDVPLWSYGPNRPVGFFDNTELAGVVADAFGFSMDKLNDRLFVEAGKAFVFYELDKTDEKNPVLKVGNAELPCNKNILRRDGQETLLEGIVVYAPMTEKVYVSRQAVNLLNGGVALDSILVQCDPEPSDQLPANCATYDFFTNTMHVPCFGNGTAAFWLDFSIVSFDDPMRFELKNFGPY